MFILFFTNFPLAWIFFGFLFVAVFGGFFFADRPDWIAGSFLFVSLIVFAASLFYKQNTVAGWVTIAVGANMSALSGFTLYWVLSNPLSLINIKKDKGYGKMDEREFFHKLSVDTDVNIELLKDLSQNEEFLNLTKDGNIIDATGVIRSLQPRVGLREAKMIAEAFAERKVG
jgi:hypothetical protein